MIGSNIVKFQKYQITLNREQAQIISKALDFYSRIIGGQFNEIKNLFWAAKPEDFKEVGKILTRLKFLLTGMEENGNLGIGNISEDGRNAYDLHQVIRHRLAVDMPELHHEFSVDFHSPLQWGTQPFAEIEGVK